MADKAKQTKNTSESNRSNVASTASESQKIQNDSSPEKPSPERDNKQSTPTEMNWLDRIVSKPDSSYIKAVFWCAMFTALLPGLVKHAQYLWISNAARLFPVIYLTLIVVAVIHVRNPVTSKSQRAWLGRILIVLSFLCSGLGYLISSTHMVQLGFGFAFASLLSVQAPNITFGRIFLTGFYSAIICLPAWLLLRAENWLLTNTNSMVSGALDYFQVVFLRDGNVFELNQGVFDLSEYSKFGYAIIAGYILFGSIMAIKQRPLLTNIVMLLLVPYLALVINLVMTLLILLGSENLPFDLASSTRNQQLLWHALLIAYYGLVGISITEFLTPIPPPNNNDPPPLAVEVFNIITSWPLERELNDAQRMMAYGYGYYGTQKRKSTKKKQPAAIKEETPKVKISFWLIPLAPLLVIMTLAFIAYNKKIGAPKPFPITAELQSLVPQAANLDLRTVGFTASRWQRLDRQPNDLFGKHSSQWTSSNFEGTRILSFDYPITTQTDYLELLKQLGHRQLKQKENFETPDGRRFSMVEIQMQGRNESSLLLYATIDDSSQPAPTLWSKFMSSIRQGPIGLALAQPTVKPSQFTGNASLMFHPPTNLSAEQRDQEITRFIESLTEIEQSIKLRIYGTVSETEPDTAMMHYPRQFFAPNIARALVDLN